MAPKNLPIPSSSPQTRSNSPLVQPTQYGSPNALNVPQIPSHGGTPICGSPRNASPSLRPVDAVSTPDSGSGGQVGQQRNIDDLTEAQKAEIVRRHLLSADEQREAAAAESGVNTPVGGDLVGDQHEEDGPQGGDEEYPTPYALQGGDIVAPIYKWAAQQGGGNGGSDTPPLRRSKSLQSLKEASSRRVSHSTDARPPHPSPGGLSTTQPQYPSSITSDENDSSMGVREILEPGGFRRDFVIRRMASGGQLDANNGAGGGRFTRSFVDFLSLYGHFGGEDLEEIDELDEEDDLESGIDYDASTIRGFETTPPNITSEATPKAKRTLRGMPSSEVNERTPLVNRRQATQNSTSEGPRGASRKRASSVGQHGDATVTQAVLMLLKSFVGTGVLFLGKAFFNGGIVFSAAVLCFIAMISLYSFLLLVDTRLVVHGSFGDIGGILFGPKMRLMILFSIVLSQIGFVAAYTIFVAQNLQAFFMAVSNCATFIPIQYLMLCQLVIFLPLSMIRNIQKLSGTALIADAFILFGLVYIFSNEIKVLADFGLGDVKLFNSKDFPLLIGTAVFSFEGIGLVIPITESMKDPHQFPRVLTGVMVGVMILFAGAGVLAYAAYGSAIQTVVFVNLPQDDHFVQAAQFLYSIAILLSTPLQLFPAVRIMENGIFSRSGKHSTKVKWEKNLFRFSVVIGCTAVAWGGASDLDKFVSLIGSVACVPLCFCYPALLHYKACATTRKQKAADIALFIFGVAAAIYTTSQTVIMLASGGESAPPTFGKCPPRG